jgi:hypothetical protein
MVVSLDPVPTPAFAGSSFISINRSVSSFWQLPEDVKDAVGRRACPAARRISGVNLGPGGVK